MAISSKHPLFSKYLEDWVLCQDCYQGERAVKEKGMLYLPATAGMIADGARTVNSIGWEAYQAYKKRAVFHEFFSEAVETFMGMMWNKPPVIDLPKSMEPMREKATVQGETLEQLLMRINEHQLVRGRLGLFADFPAKPTTDQVTPYLALYAADTIINWDDGVREEIGYDRLNLVVIDETTDERNSEFGWERKEKYRVLVLGDPTQTAGIEPGLDLVYRAGVMQGTTFNAEQLIEPTYKGRKLNKLPFAFINSKDTVTQPDDPPLLGLANLCMAIYRGEADLRQSLFLQGQDTLVVIGGDKDASYRIGANASINIKQGGDAKFIGVSADGLKEQREALDGDKQLAQQKAGKLADMKSGQRESGDALKTRLGSQTATLKQIALAGAAGLEQVLRVCAEWVGANPDEVKVTPNLEFDTLLMTGQELVQLVSAKNMGAPISTETIHDNMVARGMTKKTLEEELEAIETEAPLVVGGPGAISDPDDPNYDPNKDPNYDPEKDPESSRFKDPKQEHERAKDLLKTKEALKPKPKAKPKA